MNIDTDLKYFLVIKHSPVKDSRENVKTFKQTKKKKKKTDKISEDSKLHYIILLLWANL